VVNSMIADHHKSSPDTKMAEGSSLDGFRERLKPYELAHSKNLMKDDYRVMLLDHLSMLGCRRAMSEQVDTQIATAVSQMSSVFQEIVDSSLARLATKGTVKSTVDAMQDDISALRAQMKDILGRQAHKPCQPDENMAEKESRKCNIRITALLEAV